MLGSFTFFYIHKLSESRGICAGFLKICSLLGDWLEAGSGLLDIYSKASDNKKGYRHLGARKRGRWMVVAFGV